MGRGGALTGVIFDCDGTLVDSEPLSGETWRRVTRPFGYEITDDDLAEVVGFPYVRTHAFFASRVALPAPEVLLPELNRVLFALIDERLEVFADAVTAVEELRARGVRIAVASSSVRERLDRTLAHAGLAFEVTIAGDEVEHGKPAPDMFLLAAAAAGAAAGGVRRGRGLAAGRRRRAGRRDADAGRPARPGNRPLGRHAGGRRASPPTTFWDLLTNECAIGHWATSDCRRFGVTAR